MLPGARVFAFDSRGSLVFQNVNEPRKQQERLWAGLRVLQDKTGPGLSEGNMQIINGICRNRFGSITQLGDLLSEPSMPVNFCHHGLLHEMLMICPVSRA